MPRRPALTALPPNLKTGLLLLERGHALRSGGKVMEGKLPEKVLDLFNRLEIEEVDWVMVGAEAINLYIERPRATVDVDIVVRAKHLRKVKNILETLCADVKDTEVHFKAVLSKEPMRLDIDVIKSTSHELFEAALDHQVSKEGVRVPRVEALLALKYLSCISPRRALEDKRFDVADFGRAYKQNRKLVDRKLLIDLAARADKNVREEFESFLEAVENDRPITI